MNKLNQLTNADNPTQWGKHVNNAFGAELRVTRTGNDFATVEVYDDAPTVSLLIDAAHAQGMRIADVNTDDTCEYILTLKGGAQ